MQNQARPQIAQIVQSVSTLDVSRNQETGMTLFCDIHLHLNKSIHFHTTKKDTQKSVFSDSGSVLLSRAVAHQVSSALRSLTTVFGMGTGVTFLLLPPNVCQTPLGVLTQVCVSQKLNQRSFGKLVRSFVFFMAYSIIV